MAREARRAPERAAPIRPPDLRDEVDRSDHCSTIEGLKGGPALRNAVIGTDQVMPFAGPVLHAAGIRVDDDYLDPPSVP